MYSNLKRIQAVKTKFCDFLLKDLLPNMLVCQLLAHWPRRDENDFESFISFVSYKHLRLKLRDFYNQCPLLPG